MCYAITARPSLPPCLSDDPREILDSMRSAFPPAPVCLPCATTGFRPLAVGDLEMLHGWLNRPHVIEHYQKTAHET
jgi:hypothetical protein